MTENQKNEIYKVAHIVRDKIFEPYEFDKSLESIRTTTNSINEKLTLFKKKSKDFKNQLFQYTDKTKNFRIKATEIKEKVIDTLQTKAGQYKTKQKQQVIELEQGDNKKIESYSIKKHKWNQLIEQLQTSFNFDFGELKNKSKINAQKLTDKVKEFSLRYIQNGIELLVSQNGEAWIVGVAREKLKREDIFSYKEIRDLSDNERSILIDELYPFSNSWLKEHSSTFDYTVNIVLGAIVFTNIPLTGLLVGMINVAKTIIKIANRLYILSNIYGYEIKSSEGLYKTSAMIIQSMNDWELNAEHKPLDCQVIEELFKEHDSDNFLNLMKETLLKESYISIPFVGMLSVSKINSDDFKTDILILHLFKNYYFQQELIESLGKKKFNQLNQEFKDIYQKIIDDESIKKMQETIILKNTPQNQKFKFFQYLKTDKNSNSDMLLALQEEAIKKYNKNDKHI